MIKIGGMKMKPKQLLIPVYVLMLMITIHSALGVVCKDVVVTNESCTLITPVTSCDSYFYNITFEDGSNVENGILGVDSGVHYLNFSKSVDGGYVVQTCDESFKVMTVNVDNLYITTNNDSLCNDYIVKDITCKVLTPTISCGSGFTLINNNLLDITTGNTSFFNNDLSYFNFSTNASGGYVVSLCDGSYKEFYVLDNISSAAAQVINNYYTTTNSGGGSSATYNTDYVTQVEPVRAGFTPRSIFWGVDLWFESVDYKLFQKTSEDKLFYALEKLDERQAEAIKCAKKGDSDCLLFLVNDADTSAMVITSFGNVENPSVTLSKEVRRLIDALRVTYQDYTPDSWSKNLDNLYKAVV
jgi:hypothetical protein